MIRAKSAHLQCKLLKLLTILRLHKMNYGTFWSCSIHPAKIVSNGLTCRRRCLPFADTIRMRLAGACGALPHGAQDSMAKSAVAS